MSAIRLDDPEQAVLVHWLLTNFPDWMLRRVENFKLLDDRTVERRTSFDFKLPGAIEGRSTTALTVVPLTTLDKEKLVGFDLRDEEGRSLPVLDTRDNEMVAGAALAALAESVLDAPP